MPFSTQAFFFSISCYLSKLNDSLVHLVSESESDTSPDPGIGVSLDSHLSPLAHNCMSQEFISLSDDSDSERVSVNSLDEEAYSFYYFEAFLSNDSE